MNTGPIHHHQLCYNSQLDKENGLSVTWYENMGEKAEGLHPALKYCSIQEACMKTATQSQWLLKLDNGEMGVCCGIQSF